MKKNFRIYGVAITLAGVIAFASCKKSLPEEPYKTVVIITKSMFGGGINNHYFAAAYLLRDLRVLPSCGVDTSSFVDMDGDGFPASSVNVTACSGTVVDGSLSITYNLSGDFSLIDNDDSSPGNGQITLGDEANLSLEYGSKNVNITLTPKGSGSGWYFTSDEMLVGVDVSYQKHVGSGTLNLTLSLDTARTSFNPDVSGTLLTPRSGSMTVVWKGSVSQVQRNGADGTFNGGNFNARVNTKGSATVDSTGVLSSGSVTVDVDGDAVDKELGDVEGI